MDRKNLEPINNIPFTIFPQNFYQLVTEINQ